MTQKLEKKQKKLFEEAQEILQVILSKNLFEAKGIVGFYPANGVQEDIELYSDDDRTEKIGTLFGLRQQLEKINKEEPYFALGDFVAPKESNVKDYVGIFAVTIFGAEETSKYYLDQQDDYSSLLAKVLADRFAEAFAEALHLDVRKQYWGYSKDEELNPKELFKIKYQGIRPAFGYPSQPDHDEKKFVWDLMKVKEEIGCELTEPSFMMMPGSSVSGIILSHGNYFGVGEILKDQMDDYAFRKGKDVEYLEKSMPNILGYKI